MYICHGAIVSYLFELVNVLFTVCLRVQVIFIAFRSCSTDFYLLVAASVFLTVTAIATQSVLGAIALNSYSLY